MEPEEREAMSTKIHHGWRLPEGTAAPPLARRLDDALRPVWNVLAAEAVGTVAVMLHSNRSAGLGKVLALFCAGQVEVDDLGTYYCLADESTAPRSTVRSRRFLKAGQPPSGAPSG